MRSGASGRLSRRVSARERFRQVVVRAGVEPLHAGLDGIARGQHQHGDVGARGAQLAADRQPVASREHHVENDGVVIVLLALLRRGDPVGGDVHGVSGLAQPLRDEPRRGRLVLDQQNPHGMKLIPER